MKSVDRHNEDQRLPLRRSKFDQRKKGRNIIEQTCLDFEPGMSGWQVKPILGSNLKWYTILCGLTFPGVYSGLIIVYCGALSRICSTPLQRQNIYLCREKQQQQQKTKNNGLVLLTIAILVHWDWVQVFLAANGQDANGLQLEKFRLKFSSSFRMTCAYIPHGFDQNSLKSSWHRPFKCDNPHEHYWITLFYS